MLNRFDVNCFGDMHKRPDGDYVEYAEVEPLINELEYLREEVQSLREEKDEAYQRGRKEALEEAVNQVQLLSDCALLTGNHKFVPMLEELIKDISALMDSKCVAEKVMVG